jgi:hypothetical protein
VAAPSTGIDQGSSLESFRRDLILTRVELWVHYVGLGGRARMGDVSGYLAGERQLDRLEHNTIAQALNERFMDLGGNHPVPYLD